MKAALLCLLLIVLAASTYPSNLYASSGQDCGSPSSNNLAVDDFGQPLANTGNQKPTGKPPKAQTGQIGQQGQVDPTLDPQFVLHPYDPILPTPTQGRNNCGNQYQRPTLSNKFTLSLQYAARNGIALCSNQGKVFWNNDLIATLAPNDYNVHTFTADVTVVVGTNTLSIQGAGTSDSYGLGIDNVQLVRVGTNNNIVINGGFQRPPQNGGWSIYAGIEGWTSNQIQIGNGKIYNCQWTSQICELDGNHNDKISQDFTFDKYNIQIDNKNCGCGDRQSKTFTLSVQYAARNGIALCSNQANIYWNNVLIATLAPSDYNVHTFTQTVTAVAGTNTLTFTGAGTQDSYGLGIDNVQLIRSGTNNNVVVNGGFERPAQNGGWNIYPGIEGWTSDQIEIGNGKIYNCQWTSQICELDGNHNDKISQSFNFGNSC